MELISADKLHRRYADAFDTYRSFKEGLGADISTHSSAGACYAT